MYFGLLTTGWSLATARFWLTELPAPNAAVEVLIAMMFAPLVGCAVQFVLCYAGARLQPMISEVWMWRVRAWLWVQCALVPLTLVWLGFDRIFVGVSLWYPIFAIEICAGISYFLLAAGKRRRPEFWLMSVIMGVVVAVLGIELSYQSGWIKLWGVHVTHFVMPVLYAAVAIRLMQVYAKALQAAQGAKAKLEQRVKEVTAEMERNFNQIAELRAEQVAEKERKRIASDLHDDLGAKLLTIVHTSNNDRISTLAREALEEMRLSVRGLTPGGPWCCPMPWPTGAPRWSRACARPASSANGATPTTSSKSRCRRAPMCRPRASCGKRLATSSSTAALRT